ncbi:MAG: hypothetical protein RLZZ58_1944 [Pseudomonadota bacterium]
MFGAASILFVPGARPERFAKAAASGADAICIDLEDAVAAEDKDSARDAALHALATLDPARTAIRINGLRTAAGLRDLLALRDAAIRPAHLFIPMVESPFEMDQARAILNDAAAGLVPLVETVAGLSAALAIAARPGVTAIMFGGGDFSAELGVDLAWTPLLAARSQMVMAAAAANIAAIDVPFIALDDAAGLADECGAAKALGFAAKAAIHPAQVGAINAAFHADVEQIAAARRAIAAYDAAGGRAIRFEGRMLESPIIKRYQRLLLQEERTKNA